MPNSPQQMDERLPCGRLEALTLCNQKDSEMGVTQDLLDPPAGMRFDFTEPVGEAALAPAGGVMWRILGRPVTSFIGGVAAVLLELAEPSVRSGVWDHTTFRTDPLKRLRRTGFSAMITVYGAQSKAREEIARVVRVHGHVSGTTPGGKPYHANDPQLLDWVQATATFGFAEAYHRFARHLSRAEKDAAFAEGQSAAELFGATGAPRSWADWERLLALWRRVWKAVPSWRSSLPS